MNRMLIMLVAFTLVLSCKKEDISGDTGVLKTITSLTEYENDIKSGVSLMFFHATWCTKCAAQRPAVEGLTKDATFSAVKFGQVDYEKIKDVSDKYQVAGFPTILIYKNNVLKHELLGQGHSQQELTNLIKALL
ncbi:MAG: thioredoxin family protein [Saprospiraceae bacterium]|nr:thioredoxin family protein [Saprospiraceae bacterium]MBK8668532.1 thioredoxin family protein [Saprospiraceae bacterium]MBL0098859.1 thioredoxin family protein [Saprospiraceae bacterium]